MLVCSLAILEVQPGFSVDSLDEGTPVDDANVVHLHGSDDPLPFIESLPYPVLDVDVVLVRLPFIWWSHCVVNPPVLVVDVDVDLKSRENLFGSRLPSCPCHDVLLCVPTESVNERFMYSNITPPLCQEEVFTFYLCRF